MEKSFQAAVGKEREPVQALAYAGISFLLACTSVSGERSPLAMALISGTSGLQSVFALFGGIVGCLSGGSFGAAIPYIAAMAIVAAFRMLFGHIGAKAIAGISAALAGSCVFSAEAFAAQGVPDIFAAFASGAVTVVCSLAYTRLIRLFPRLNAYGIVSAAPADLISAGILYSVLIAALTGISIMPFDLGIMLSAAAIVLLTDLKKGYPAAAGILSAAGIAVGEPGFMTCCIILALCGLAAALTEKYSRLTRACAVIFVSGAGVFITGIDEYSAAFAVSAISSSLVCAFIPERLLPTYKGGYSRETALEAPCAAFGKKLSGMSAAIGEMNEAVRKTAKALDKRETGDISVIYLNAADRVCRGCRNNMQCWGSSYNRSADIMNKAVQSIRSGALADENMLDGHFAALCEHRRELSQELNKQYAMFCSSQSAARKIAQMRGLLSAQLDAAKKMLDSVSEELSAENVCDRKAAGTVCSLLREYGLNDPSALAVIIDGKLTIDAYGGGGIGIDGEGLSERLSFALRKSFDPPMIAENDGQTHITVCERSPFDAQIRVFQKSRSGSRRNGDCCDCFNDGHGSVYLLLSDGMGSGSRARIDSSFACGMLSRMLKAGIDLDASMEMLNTSLLVKSSDESFATLDVCRVDLYSGEVTLCKAGAAETFVRCGKKFARLEGGGIPFGVNIPASYSEKRFTLSEGDVIIMTSDGAELEQKWLERLVMRDKSADLDAIIDTAGEALSLSAEKGKEDDMTVIGVKITK